MWRMYLKWLLRWLKTKIILINPDELVCRRRCSRPNLYGGFILTKAQSRRGLDVNEPDELKYNHEND